MSQLLNRVERIQHRFPWMREVDAHSMLVAKYFLFKVRDGLEDVELYAAMEEFVNELMITPDEAMRRAIDNANSVADQYPKGEIRRKINDAFGLSEDSE